MHIDRSTPFTLDTPRPEGERKPFNNLIGKYEIDQEDPDAVALTDIDPARIELKMVFDQDALADNTPDQYNDIIKNNFEALQTDGYILLDAKVVETLLEHPELIPKEWESVTDEDTMSEAHGSIGFYGTTFRYPDERRDRVILTPYWSRGYWNGDQCESFYFTGESLGSFKRGEISHVRKYAAVYKR